MDILDFYKRLSQIIENYDNYGSTKSTAALKTLLKEAKEAGLEVDIDDKFVKNSISEFYEESSYEESSYDSYEEESSYEDDSSYND